MVGNDAGADRKKSGRHMAHRANYTGAVHPGQQGERVGYKGGTGRHVPLGVGAAFFGLVLLANLVLLLLPLHADRLHTRANTTNTQSVRSVPLVPLVPLVRARVRDIDISSAN